MSGEHDRTPDNLLKINDFGDLFPLPVRSLENVPKFPKDRQNQKTSLFSAS
jgi:hypothetical protein